MSPVDPMSPTGQVGAPSVPRAVLAAAALTGVEGLALLGLSISYLTTGRSGSALSAPVWIAVAVLLLVLARGLSRLRRPALTPVVLIQLLALPVGWSLLRDGQPVAGAITLLLAGGVLALLFGPRSARSAFD